MRAMAALFCALAVSGCASWHYRQVEQGDLRGKLLVQWINPDEFILIPDEQNPLTFVRYNDDVISPGRMYTDGGSIPRPLWAFRSYSPWGYAPAFIIHDWLFDMKHCQLPGNEKYDLDEAAWIMSEVMKTMMEKEGGEVVDKLTVYTMFEATRSPIAARLWETGDCEQPPVVAFELRPQPVLQYVIEAP